MVEKIKLNLKENYKKYILILLVLLLFTFLFFQFVLVITPDGSDYYLLSSIIRGEVSFEEWSIIRGPTFPFIIALFRFFFGSSSQGILIGMYCFMILLFSTSYLLLKNQIKYNKEEKHQINYWIFFVLLLVFNPLIISYSHILLTESVFPAMLMLTVYLAYRWYDAYYTEDKKKYIIYALFFSIISIASWFLKQPYFPVIIFILGITAIMSAISQHSLKVFIEKIVTIIICILMTLASIFIWGKFVSTQNVEKKSSINNMAAGGLINGLSYNYRKIIKEDYCSVEYIENSLLEKKEKKEILSLQKKGENWCDEFSIYDIYDLNGKLIDQTMSYSSEETSMIRSLAFVLGNTIKAPLLTVQSYYANYMATIDLYTAVQYNGIYISNGKFSVYDGENRGIALSLYDSGLEKCWWNYEGAPVADRHLHEISLMKNFEGKIKNSEQLESFMKTISPAYLVLFKILFFLALPITIYSFIQFIRKKYHRTYFLITLLFGSAFLHILFHAMTSALIDRYAYSVYPLVLLGLILLIIRKDQTENIIIQAEGEILIKKEVKEENKSTIGRKKVVKEDKKQKPSTKKIKTKKE